jgi:hypothetical protein
MSCSIVQRRIDHQTLRTREAAGLVSSTESTRTVVYYTVKTTRIEDWAKSPDVQSAFPAVIPIVKGEEAKVRQVVIDLSSEGWDIAEYSRYLQMQ